MCIEVTNQRSYGSHDTSSYMFMSDDDIGATEVLLIAYWLIDPCYPVRRVKLCFSYVTGIWLLLPGRLLHVLVDKNNNGMMQHGHCLTFYNADIFLYNPREERVVFNLK